MLKHIMRVTDRTLEVAERTAELMTANVVYVALACLQAKGQDVYVDHVDSHTSPYFVLHVPEVNPSKPRLSYTLRFLFYRQSGSGLRVDG